MQAKDTFFTTIILQEPGTTWIKTVTSALSFGKVIVLYPPHASPVKFPGAEYIPVESSITALLNGLLHDCQSEYIAIVSRNVIFSAENMDELRTIPPEFALITGDYIEHSQNDMNLKKTYQGPEDITERADLGPVIIYRTEALKAVNGWDEKLKFAFDYDIRLRLMEKYKSWHVKQPMCYMWVSPPSTDNSASKLFFPGKGKYGGFSYLFMDKAEEAEIEAVFVDCLRRRGAYLDGDAPAMKPEAKTTPLVSVITPVYNRAKFIGMAIESVLSGKFQDFEYIVIDNGSTDNTCEVVEQIAASDSRIRLIKNNINRIAYSLNLGVKNARGKYISQLDSDDLYTPDTLQSMVNFMEETNCGLGISYYSLIDAEGNDLPEFGVIKHLEYSRNNILRVDGAGAVRMWRKTAIMELGGFDAEDLVDYGEDYDLYVKLGEKYLIGRVHEVLYKYRRHPDNSDILRDPMFKLRNKNLARERALARRKKMNGK